MKAIAIKKFGGAEVMEMVELPKPEISDEEVLIKSAYAGVNPVDWKIREGYLRERVKHQFPLILGWEAAGTVAAVGQAVQGFSVGQAVYTYCRKPVIQWGTYAEYVACDAADVAAMPESLNFKEAAAIPLVALTAWQALFEFAELQKGQTILIHAGAGGVGGMAIQLAKYCGATVLTTASSRNQAYVEKLGADIFIDYHEEDFVERVSREFPEGIDAVFDCVGGDVFLKSFKCLRRGGVLPTICYFDVSEELGRPYHVKTGYVFVRPDGEQLKEMARLFDQGKILVPHLQEFEMDKAQEALEKSREGHTRGKLVIKIKELENRED